VSLPTIESITKKLGLSRVTVWRALRGHPSVHPKTAERVRACAEEIGYISRNEEWKTIGAAQENLRRKTSSAPTILVPYNKEGLTKYGSSDVFWEYVEGIVEAAATTGTQVVMAGFENDAMEFSCICSHLENGAAGVLDFRLNAETIAWLDRRGTPRVTLQTFESLGQDSQACVRMDEIGGFTAAWRHLLEKGHRRLGFVDYRNFDGRFKTCVAAGLFADAPVSIEARVIFDPGANIEAMREAFRAALGPWRKGAWPTAFFCGKDAIAARVLRALAQEGISVPEDVSLVGFENAPVSRLGTLGITTIDAPRKEMGAAMLHLLENIIAGRPGSRAATQVLPTSLVERESVASLCAQAPDRPEIMEV